MNKITVFIFSQNEERIEPNFEIPDANPFNFQIFIISLFHVHFWKWKS